MRFIKTCIITLVVTVALGIGFYLFGFKLIKNNDESYLKKTFFSTNIQSTMMDEDENDMNKKDLLKLLNRKVDYSTIELAAIFPQKEGFKWHFNGPADYGKSMTITNVIRENDKISIIITGNLDDLSDGEAGKTDFHFSYTITNESIKDSSDFIILKKPLVIGNEWDNQYMLGEKTYSALTRITALTGDFITTESVINNVPNYPNEKYWRKEVYQLGKGLVFYAEMVEEDYGGCVLDYIEDSISDISYEFESCL
jgi:hypothetical protein